MHCTLYLHIPNTWTERFPTLKAPQDELGQKTGGNEPDDSEDIRRLLKEQEERRFLEYFRSPPCKLCGMNDHNMVKRTIGLGGHYTEEYECPVSSNIGTYDRSIGSKIFEMSDKRFLDQYCYNQEAIIEAYRTFTTTGAGSRIPIRQRQLRLQNLVNTCVKEREMCASTFKSINRQEAIGDDDEEDDEGYIIDSSQIPHIQETFDDKDEPSLDGKVESSASQGEDIKTNMPSKRAKTNVNYNEDTPPSENEQFESYLEYLTTHNESGMGTGVIATRQINKGVLLGEYTGEIKTLKEVIDRTELDPPYYIVATETVDHFIDGEDSQGNILKYINHKCVNPNCELVNLTPTRVGILTRRKIKPNESLNYNYHLIYPEGSVVRRIKCVCTPECPNYL